MENLRIFINSNDIKKYLLSHKDDKNLKYKEALFLKYLDDTNMYTKEKFEMGGIDTNNKELLTFEKYIELIKKSNNIETSDISLMLVPALGLNGLYTGDIDIGVKYIYNYARLLDENANMEKVIKEAIYRLRNYSKEYYNSMNKIDYPIKEIGIFNDTLGRYAKLRNIGVINYNGRDFSLIGKDRCEKELASYSEIYGSDAVEIIKDYTKELKKDYL